MDLKGVGMESCASICMLVCEEKSGWLALMCLHEWGLCIIFRLDIPCRGSGPSVVCVCIISAISDVFSRARFLEARAAPRMNAGMSVVYLCI